jgi:hypothetical protein
MVDVKPSGAARSALRLSRGWGSPGPFRPRWLACGVAVAPAVARHPQTERLEAFFDAQAHRRVSDVCLRLNLPPLTRLAQSPVGCGHHALPPCARWASPRRRCRPRLDHRRTRKHLARFFIPSAAGPLPSITALRMDARPIQSCTKRRSAPGHPPPSAGQPLTAGGARPGWMAPKARYSSSDAYARYRL